MDYQNSYSTQPAANDGCLGWEDEIQQESSFVLLEEGDYPFTVEKLERSRYSPKAGAKIPACNQAVVTFDVGGTTLTENFQLHTKMEWKISALYAAIGMKQQGAKVRMNWPAVMGRSGYCHVGVRAWKKDDGTTGQANQISKFYAPWDKEYPSLQAKFGGSAQPQPVTYQQPSAQPQYIPQQQTMYATNPNPWTPGKF